MATLQPMQGLFALCMLSNLGDLFTGTVERIEAELGGKINQLLSDLSAEMGPWKVVWGPAVFQAWDSDRTDNVMTHLAVVGHSLGGALSPAVALWLSDSRDLWDPSGRVAISVLPSAGPTPGNQDFAIYYDSQLGGATERIHNRIGVVPHAWATSETMMAMVSSHSDSAAAGPDS